MKKLLLLSLTLLGAPVKLLASNSEAKDKEVQAITDAKAAEQAAIAEAKAKEVQAITDAKAAEQAAQAIAAAKYGGQVAQAPGTISGSGKSEQELLNNAKAALAKGFEQEKVEFQNILRKSGIPAGTVVLPVDQIAALITKAEAATNLSEFRAAEHELVIQATLLFAQFRAQVKAHADSAHQAATEAAFANFQGLRI